MGTPPPPLRPYPGRRRRIVRRGRLGSALERGRARELGRPAFYDAPATGPHGRRVTVTVILNGSDDEGYTFCAVAVTPPAANIYDNAAFNFVVGEDACGF